MRYLCSSPEHDLLVWNRAYTDKAGRKFLALEPTTEPGMDEHDRDDAPNNQLWPEIPRMDEFYLIHPGRTEDRGVFHG
jgi:hypothetical protein